MTDEPFVNQNDVEGTASGVWSRMLAGNRRFAEGKLEHPNRSVEARGATIDTHEPEAAILSCSDARVSPDIIFDAGIGDLFTVRTAGQVIDDAVIASLEYAVDVLGVRLLVVLGHQNCGAIKQACKEYEALLADALDGHRPSSSGTGGMAPFRVHRVAAITPPVIITPASSSAESRRLQSVPQPRRPPCRARRSRSKGWT